CGGIYDQVGGGFARYSVDGHWFAPHFEKMLYDNGQLLSLYSEAFLVTGNTLFRTVVEQTIEWLAREMTHPEGGFYSALDADSEGVEGKFYCWTADELAAALGPDHALAMEYFGCTAEGNWEHGRNILLGRPSAERPAQLKEIRSKLLQVREQRIRPGLDDKIITAWNAITIIGLADAALAFGRKEWLDVAIKAWDFSLRYLTVDGRLLRSFRGKPSAIDAFLDDMVFQIKAGLTLYEATFERRFLDEAVRLLNMVNEEFADGEASYWYTSRHSAELIVRKKETWDNVIPSSNSVLASLLHRMGILMDRDDWVRRSANMVAAMAASMEQGPAYSAQWGIALMEHVHGLDELVLAGSKSLQIRRDLAGEFLPMAMFCGEGNLPLAVGKTQLGDQDTIYLCHHRTCKAPMFTIEEVLKAIRERKVV
ncbi:MAG: thioredoxin domain-containing protein, partial [Bacteroidota bacterium]